MSIPPRQESFMTTMHRLDSSPFMQSIQERMLSIVSIEFS